MNENHKINIDGINLIKDSEGLALKAYKCPAGKWTIGYGHTLNVNENDEITQEQAEKYLLDDIELVYDCILKTVKVELTENQFSALCCFIYNIGCGNFEQSTLLKLINKKQFKEAANEFTKWIYAGKTIIAGLATRRREERKLFLEG